MFNIYRGRNNEISNEIHDHETIKALKEGKKINIYGLTKQAATTIAEALLKDVSVKHYILFGFHTNMDGF